MRYVGLVIAGLLLAFAVSDVVYLSRAWSEFLPRDAAHHIHFQIWATLLVAWHTWLTARCWHASTRVHIKLVAGFLGLCTVLVLYSLLEPLFWKMELEGGPKNEWFLLVVATLVAAFGWWSWRVSNGAQQGVPADRALHPKK